MNIKLLMGLTLTAALLGSGCSMNHDEYNMWSAKPVALTMEQSKLEGKVAGSIIALDRNEVAAANLAMNRATHPAVKQYAMMMRDEHTKNMQQMEQLSAKLGVKPMDGMTAMQLKKKGKHDLAMLKHTSAKNFDKAYMSMMVKGHMDALALIDRLQMDAVNPMMKNQLKMTRSHVEMHLNEAKKISSMM